MQEARGDDYEVRESFDFEYVLVEFDGLLEHLSTMDQEEKVRLARSGLYGFNKAYEGRRDIAPAPLVYEFALTLGVLLEAASFFTDAEFVLGKLVEEPFISLLAPQQAVIARTKLGEYRRRIGKLDEAEHDYAAALQLLGRSLTVAASSSITNQYHGDRGRLLYELAYLHRLRGDAAASAAAIEESAIECGLADDPVGVEIARCLLASITCEEGDPQAGASQLVEIVLRLESLCLSDTVRAAGRDRLARRWLDNAQSALARAFLGCSDTARARPLVKHAINRLEDTVSIRGLSYERCIEARLLLAENRLAEAQQAIKAAYHAVEISHNYYDGTLESTELGAAITAMSGLCDALIGNCAGADGAFRKACKLPPDLHNRRAQAWSWAALAILARGKGDRDAAQEAIGHGLALVQRCGAPIRSFLLELQRDLSDGRDHMTMFMVRELVCRYGD